MDRTICLNSKVNGKQPSLQDRIYDVEGCSTAITTSFLPSIAEPKIIIGYVNDGKHQQDYIQHEEGISRAICVGAHGSGAHLTKTLVREPNVLTPKRTEFGKAVRKEYESGQLNMSRHDMTTMEPRTDGISNTLTSVLKDNLLSQPSAEMRYRIRRLTPRECFRLMGVDDVDIDKIQASGISNSQQYKCAGNSIVVDTLYHLFRKMFCETENENAQPTLF